MITKRECLVDKLAKDHDISDRDQMNSAVRNAEWAQSCAEQSLIRDVPSRIFELEGPLAAILEIMNRDAERLPKVVKSTSTNKFLLSEINFTELVQALVSIRHPGVPVDLDNNLNPEWCSYFDEVAGEVERWLVMTHEMLRAASSAHRTRKAGRPPDPRTAAYRVLANYWTNLGRRVERFGTEQPTWGTSGAFIVDAMKIIAPSANDNQLVESVRNFIADDYLGGRKKKRSARCTSR